MPQFLELSGAFGRNRKIVCLEWSMNVAPVSVVGIRARGLSEESGHAHGIAYNMVNISDRCVAQVQKDARHG